jgi:hypothetical protein
MFFSRDRYRYRYRDRNRRCRLRDPLELGSLFRLLVSKGQLPPIRSRFDPDLDFDPDPDPDFDLDYPIKRMGLSDTALLWHGSP